MLIIDRYTINRFITRLIGALIAGAVIFIVVDMVENLDKFIDARVPLSRALSFYLLFLPYIFYLILPVAALLATLFNIGGLSSGNELIAMRAMGIPFYRLVVGMLGIAVIGAGGAFILGETVVPSANRKRLDIYRYEVKRIPKETRVHMGRYYFQIAPGGHLYIDRYLSSTREAYGLELVEVESGRVKKRTEWEKMTWRDQRWLAQGVLQREFIYPNEERLTFIGDTLLNFPSVKPEEMERVQTVPEEMTYSELKVFLERLRDLGGETRKWEVERYFKIAMPSATTIIVLFGAPLAALQWGGGGVLAFGLALLVCFIYYGLIYMSKILGYTGTFTPFLSAWVVNIVFFLLGGFLLWKVR
ncbi:MAG: LptF/LptG family permease [bacterium]